MKINNSRKGKNYNKKEISGFSEAIITAGYWLENKFFK